MHITYEIEQSTTKIELKGPKYDKLSSAGKRQKFIQELEAEQKAIVSVCSKLMKFLSANSLTPINDAIFDYIDICINEERAKLQNGASNEEVVFGLERVKAEYQFVKERMDDAEPLTINASADGNSSQLEEMNKLIESLYALPLNGQTIKVQMERLQQAQSRVTMRIEKTFDLSAKLGNSVLAKQLFE